MSVRLWHYTDKPLTIDARRYEQPAPRLYGKPEGLWISVEGEDDWPSWCAAEGFSLDQLAYRTPIAIRPASRVLRVTPGELNAFDRDFCSELQWGTENQWVDRAVDWRRVASAFDGIIIAPYSWHHRMALNWYYTWDCASGCIWNIDAIEIGESIPCGEYQPDEVR